MNYLADTHVLLWSFLDPDQLSANIVQLLVNESNAVYYSPINLWEIAIKYGLKKLNLQGITPEEFYEKVDNSFYICKEISNADIIASYRLPRYHKDPFDRFLAWEAIRNGFILISVDETMQLYQKEGLKIVY